MSNTKTQHSDFELEQSILVGNLKIIQMLLDAGYIYHNNCLVIACESHNNAIVEYLVKCGCELTEECLERALRANCIETIYYLIKKGVIINNWSLYYAVLFCDMGVLVFIKQYSRFIPICYMAAIRKKSKVLLDFLYEDSVEMDMAVFSNAISVGQKWIWDYLVERGCQFGPEIYFELYDSDVGLLRVSEVRCRLACERSSRTLHAGAVSRCNCEGEGSPRAPDADH